LKARIHEELDGIFSDDMTRDITIEDLRNMKYLEQCIKESLRLYPSVPYIARQNSQPFTVENYEVPKDTTCLILIYFLHRDPNYFPNPEVFDPERFSSDSDNRHPYAFVPFSAGPRNCIGQKFALLEEKALLSSILRKYKIKSLLHRNEMKLDIAAILKPNSEIKIKFEERF
jgi:cytochrome P450